jgi:hypothetical protein
VGLDWVDEKMRLCHRLGGDGAETIEVRDGSEFNQFDGEKRVLIRNSDSEFSLIVDAISL